MSRFVGIITILLSCWPFVLMVQADSPEVQKARQYGAEGRVTLCVLNSTGSPVEKAALSVALFPSDSYANADVREGQTDTNGCFGIEGTTVADMTYTITKEGYCKTTGKYWFYRKGDNCVQNGRWQPWNITNKVVLKENRTPVPMYAKKVDVSIPIRDVPIGFDLEEGDWVAPYGHGIRSDFIITYTATYEGPQVFSKRMVITFSNPQDGVQSSALDETSEFLSTYSAPEKGYLPTLEQERSRTRTEILKSQEIEKEKYLIFRVRTITDKEGNITSANYGKIYPPIDYGQMGEVPRLIFSYYLNPTVNDRNLEFDPSRNLLTNPGSMRVYMP